MLYRVTANVESDCSLSEPAHTTVGDLTVSLLPSDDNLVNKLVLSMPVSEYEDLLPRTREHPSGIPEIFFPKQPFVREITNVLQYLEAFGSFFFSITRIDWQGARHEWVPETEDEEQGMEILGASFSRSFPVPRRPLDRGILRFLLEERDRLDEFVIPLSFFREGVNEHRQLRFINAFFSFYFFIEGLHSGGKTKNRDVLRALQSSKEVRGAVERSLAALLRPANSEHHEVLSEMLGTESLSLDISGVLKFIVQMRGDLHHYSARSTRLKGHPLNQSRFESPSFLLMSICLELIPGLIMPG